MCDGIGHSSVLFAQIVCHSGCIHVFESVAYVDDVNDSSLDSFHVRFRLLLPKPVAICVRLSVLDVNFRVFAIAERCGIRVNALRITRPLGVELHLVRFHRRSGRHHRGRPHVTHVD